jgi:predicted RNA-binding Zn ribbon-like protein
VAKGHPRDEFGRVLPDASWPPDRQAPGDIEFLRRFCNSINRENGAERFATADSLDRWLIGEGAPAVRASPHDLTRLIRLREALHELVVANASGTTDAAAWEELVTGMQRVTFVVAGGGTGLDLVPAGTPVDRLVGRLAAAVIEAQRTGTWPRLKACRHCHWVVFDPSKNRSARWCSMSACGGRHNAREYRRRTRSATG